MSECQLKDERQHFAPYGDEWWSTDPNIKLIIVIQPSGNKWGGGVTVSKCCWERSCLNWKKLDLMASTLTPRFVTVGLVLMLWLIGEQCKKSVGCRLTVFKIVKNSIICIVVLVSTFTFNTSNKFFWWIFTWILLDLSWQREARFEQNKKKRMNLSQTHTHSNTMPACIILGLTLLTCCRIGKQNA